LSRAFEEAIQKLAMAFAEEREKASLEAGRDVSAQLNQFARRLRQSSRHAEWCAAIGDATEAFSVRAAVFSVQGNFLRLERASFLEQMPEIPLDEAPAFQNAAEAGDPLVALYSAQELSATLMESFGDAAGSRAHLFPILSRGRAVAILYAEGGRGEVDVHAIELIAILASAIWESRAAEAPPAAKKLIAIEPAAARLPDAHPLPEWSDIPLNDQESHLRAQRFARVQVAEIRLYKSQLVLEGRKRRSLYTLLREDIDKGRDIFKSEFVDKVPSMADYFHWEIVRTLANDDATALGEEYPGPLA